MSVTRIAAKATPGAGGTCLHRLVSSLPPKAGHNEKALLDAIRLKGAASRPPHDQQVQFTPPSMVVVAVYVGSQELNRGRSVAAAPAAA
jgi:hypothetical protein